MSSGGVVVNVERFVHNVIAHPLLEAPWSLGRFGRWLHEATAQSFEEAPTVEPEEEPEAPEPEPGHIQFGFAHTERSGDRGIGWGGTQTGSLWADPDELE